MLALALVALPAVAQDRSPPRGDAALRAAMIAAHGAARRAVGVAPLGWDEALARDAAAYAAQMARTRRFDHSPQPRGDPRQGENLWTGTRGAYRYDEMIGAWTAERRDFVNRPVPGFSRTGNYADVTHYAQLVWADTTRFGCAVAANRDEEYLVCRYLPVGNVVGRKALP